MVLADSRDTIGKLEFYFGINSNDQLLLTKFPFDPGDDLCLITCGLSLALGEWDPGKHFKALSPIVQIECNNTLLLVELNDKFFSFVSCGSMTKVWDPGRHWCVSSYIFQSDFPLVVAASFTFSCFYTQLELFSMNKERQKKNFSGLFVFPLQWMGLVRDFGLHDSLEACALEPHGVAGLGLYLSCHGYYFCALCIINKIFITEGSNITALLVQSFEVELTILLWSLWIKRWELTILAILECKTKPYPVISLISIARSARFSLPGILNNHVDSFKNFVLPEPVFCKVTEEEHDICELLCFSLLHLIVVRSSYQRQLHQAFLISMLQNCYDLLNHHTTRQCKIRRLRHCRTLRTRF